MDIEQERKEFEKWAFQASGGWASFERDSNHKYWPDKLNLAWEAWQAAKSQVVPEGFVLVPKCKSESFSQELDNYLDDLWKSGNAFDDGFVSVNEINHDKIWSLVIKAEEQSHDSQNP